MAGFETWPLDFVERLQEILRDQYTSSSFYSIAKELLQNADDAGAAVLRFGLRPGWGAAVHPLLNGDVLLALNDGAFTPGDAHAIRRFGVGSKREEAGAIGRYGLGLKSVFHWCEGFFYAASNNQSAGKGESIVELLSPWLGEHCDENHAPWDDCDRARRELAEFIGRWASDLERWFCIIIPLRNAKHVFDDVSIQPPPHPNPEQFDADMDVFELGRCAPALRSVRTIEAWNWDPQRQTFLLKERCRVDRSVSEAPAAGPAVTVSGARTVSGTVVSTPNNESRSDGARSANFIALHLRGEDPALTELKRRPEWPKTQSDRGKFVAEKAEPDCAAIAIVYRAEKGAVTIRPAVYLPLAEPVERPHALRSSVVVELLLHGQFFVDGGRKQLLKDDNRRDDIRLTWNRRLMREGPLPLLLPALHQCAAQAKLDDCEVHELTKVLRTLECVEENLASICRDYHWVYRRRWHEETIAAWSLVPQEMRVLRLPVVDDLPWIEIAEVFPYLRELGESNCVTGEADPLLSRAEPTDWADAAQEAAQLIGSATSTSLARVGVLSFLAKFLHRMRSIPDPVRDAVTQLVCKHLAQQRDERTEEWRRQFRHVLKVIGPESWIKLGSVEQDALKVVYALNELPLDNLVVPDVLAPEEIGTTFSAAECQIVFDSLAQRARSSPSQRNLVAAVALRVLEVCDRQDERLQRAVGNISVFAVRSARSDAQSTPISWNKLREYHAAGRLFAAGSTDLPLLQEALGIELYSLYAPSKCDPFRILFDSEPRRCTPTSCVEFLITGPQLRSPEHRKELFKRLLAAAEGVDDRKRRKALRYVLHGHAEKLDDLDSVLLVGASFRKQDPISRLADEALRRMEDGWRVVPDVLCRQATDDQREALGVQRVDGHSLTEILKRAAEAHSSLRWIADLGFSQSEAEQVLLALEDPALRKMVPLHQALAEREDAPAPCVTLHDRTCFLAPDNRDVCFPNLASLVTLLRRPADPRLLETYKADGMDRWGPLSALRVALGSTEPHRYADEILAALETTHGKLPLEILEQLRTVAWLPARLGPVAPQYVVDLEKLDAELDRLLDDPAIGNAFAWRHTNGSGGCDLDDPAIGNAFAWVGTIHMDWRAHSKGLAELRKRRILPTFDESIELLATCLGKLEAYRLGEIRELRDDPRLLRDVVQAFSGCEATPPMVALLNVLLKQYPDRCNDIVDGVAVAILRPSTATSLRHCVELLASQGERRSRKHGSVEHRVLCWFLRALTVHPDFDIASLAGLKLLARDGTWRRVEELCFDAEGVGEQYLIDPDLRDAFPESTRKHRSPDCGAPESPDQHRTRPGQQPAAAIVEYFERWRGYVPRPAVGGFLALLGDEDVLLQEAETSLRPRSIRDVREQLSWEPIAGSVTSGADEDIHTMMRKQRFRVCFGRDGEPIQVRNLLGRKFEARIGGQTNTLFLGDLFFAPAAGRCKTITLRELDPSRFSPQRLNELLLESSRVLLRDVYFKHSTRIDELWHQLGEATQLQIEIVQEVILESAWIVLEQLGLRSIDSISNLARRRDKLERKRAEARYSDDSRKVRDDVEQQLTALNAELRELIENDAQVQGEMLAAVREKMERHYQYSLGSLPFELLQNADDAIAELDDMVEGLGDDSARHLVQITLRTDDAGEAACTFVHWGRPINECHRGRFSAEEGRRRGYDTDLRKMLLLAASDKRERSEIVTGKFGLGFKTVYFASDRPQVLSSDLGFEVVGGLFPRKLDAETCELLSSIMRASQAGRRDGTVIHLPLSCNPSEMGDSLRAFVRQLPFMLAFARHINACEVLLDREPVKLEWSEEPIVDDTVFAGRAMVQGQHDPLACERALVFRAGPCAFLLATAPHGVVRLDRSVPVFWVSAPTRTDSRAGVAVNGTFRVDIGRTQLACERDGKPLPENINVARRLGVSVGEGLIGLFDAIRSSWDVLRDQLCLRHDVTDCDFWVSVWNVLVHAGRDENKLLGEIIWGSGRGLTRVLSEREALPTALKGKFGGLTALSAVRGVVDGILDTEEDLFERVAVWPRFCEAYGCGELVSRTRILDELPGADVIDDSELSPVTLEIAIGLEAREIGVSAIVASRLGEVVSRTALREWESRGGTTCAEEVKRLRTMLQELRFRAKSGDWVVVGELLVSQAAPAENPSERKDEWLRAAFAPADRVLHDEYSDAAIEFVLACRGVLNAPAELLAQWVLSAEEESRPAALRYLLEGELRKTVTEVVRDRLPETWLGDLTPDTLRSYGFSESEQLQLLALIGKSARTVVEMFGFGLPAATETPAVDRPRDVLRSLAEWWRENARSALANYDKRTYPDGEFPIRALDGEEIDRPGWLRLFLLACTRSMGPFRDEQHRDFLGLCDEHGWIDRLTQIRSAPDAWLACWSDYVDGKVDRITYYHWMKNLLGLSVVARYLDEYVDAFLAVDRFKQAFPLEEVTSPRSSAAFSGGGPDAPPIGPIIGVGQCFVLRELVRHGVLSNAHAHRWCYLPLRRVRKLIERLGGPALRRAERLASYSTEIHAFLSEHLDDPTFDLGFDIPLAIVAEDPELWQQLVDSEPPPQDPADEDSW